MNPSTDNTFDAILEKPSLIFYESVFIITYLCFHQFLEFGATVNSTYTYSEIAAIIEAIWVTFV